MNKLCNLLRVCPAHRHLVGNYCSHIPSEGDFDLHAAKQFAEDKEFRSIFRQFMREWRHGQGVLVAQPYKRTELNEISPPELRFQEACSLINSIPNWRPVDGGLFPCSTFRRQEFFTHSVLDKLGDLISGNPMITALFVAVEKLQGYQQYNLEKILNVPVLDRFSVILEIFRAHARTGEAMMQIQLAEIPYLLSRMEQYQGVRAKQSYGVGYGNAGSGDSPIRKYKRFLDKRTKDLRETLAKIRRRRNQIMGRRNLLEIPSIAVIGYTNSGKTSLIKTLANKDNLVPEDRLFATLDISAHPFQLPSFKNVLLLDSIGFISNVPVELMDSFDTTFRDVAQSNLLLHVYDITHPDLKNQIDTVYKTCKQLSIPEKMILSMVNVANKIDLLDNEEETNFDQELVKSDHIRFSATEKTNLHQLIEVLDQSLTRCTDRNILNLRVPNGGEEYRWLCRESKILSAQPDENDANFLVITTAITSSSRQKFTHYFGGGMFID